MALIRIVIHGAMGRVGRQMVSGLAPSPEVEIVGVVDKGVTQEYLPEPGASKLIPLSSDLENIVEKTHPQVVVDFTTREATMFAVDVAVNHGVNLVIGTTGLSSDDLVQIDKVSIANNVGTIVAPNFATGAVLMIHMARLAARFFDYAEIVEMHHEKKADAPSGTAISTAKAMAESKGSPFDYSKPERETIAGSRGSEVDGIAIHSVRMPGLFAHQEVILGSMGQRLTIRHDTVGRECYIPGVLLAIKKVVGTKGLTYGLEALLDL